MQDKTPMSITKQTHMPRSTKLFLSATLLFGLGYLVSMSGLVHFSAQAVGMITALLAISAVYGLPLSLFISRSVKKPLGVWWKVLAITVLLLLVGCSLGLASSYVLELIPTSNWKQLERSPEPLAELVTTLPINVLSGGIYGRTAAGTLYLYSCSGTCGWTKADQLPSPPDKTDYWSGTCPSGLQEPDRFVLKPLAPGRVIDSYATRYCGPDYLVDTYFILLDDGSLWSWGNFGSGMDSFLRLAAWSFFGGLLAVIWGALKK
jgi:hypothetical protein